MVRTASNVTEWIEHPPGGLAIQQLRGYGTDRVVHGAVELPIELELTPVILLVEQRAAVRVVHLREPAGVDLRHGISRVVVNDRFVLTPF